MFSFHLYGLIVGAAIAAVIFLMETKVRQVQFPLKEFWRLLVWAGVGAAIGARAYHVWTDWALYSHNWLAAFWVWRGGLSILGAGLGGTAGVALAVLLSRTKSNWRTFADIAVFGIPFGQAIGRLGNFVNQELYGPPSHLPWAIFIDPAHRLPAYQQFAYYQPLFAYELLCTTAFGLAVWWCYRGGRHSLISKPHSLIPIFGSGQVFLTYVLFYCVVRFLLDFLRLDKTAFGGSFGINIGLGLNQVVLLIVIIATAFLWWRNYRQIARMKHD